jgi:hypothetical protein
MALASLADVKAQLDIQPSNLSQDTRLTLYINAATQAIETYCGREFTLNATRTEYHDGDGSNAVLTNQWPINSISELWIDSGRLFTDITLKLAATDYGYQGTNRITLFNQISPKASGVIKIIYSSGYATAPYDLNLACIWLVEWFYFHRNRQDMGRTTASKGDESIGVLAEAPKMILQLLNPYRDYRSGSQFSAVVQS